MSNSIHKYFLRLKEIVMLSGLSRSTIFRLIKQNKFPNSVKLSGRAVGWKKSDFDDWCEKRK